MGFRTDSCHNCVSAGTTSSDPQNSPAACGGSNHFVGLATRDAGRQRAAVGVRDEDRLFRRRNRVQAGALPAVRHIDRHSDRIHPGDQIPAECRKPSVMTHMATVADLVFGVTRELREPLAHPVERFHVIQAAKMIRILHAEDDPDLAFLPGPLEVVRAVHAHEIIRMPSDKPIPFLKPRPGDVIRLAGLERDCRMENVDPGAAQLPKIAVGESSRLFLPLIEQRPVQGQQADHVNDICLGDKIDGACRIRG